MTYALNRAMPADQMVQFVAVAESTQKSLIAASNGVAAPENPRLALSDFIRTERFATHCYSVTSSVDW
jgi:PiT family inorganic phosphate transporter